MAVASTGTYGLYYRSAFSESEQLSQEQMEANAIYINTYLSAKGWSKNAICAMLGNMQAESSINPGRWQSDDVDNLSGGYGLVQWTPASKYIDWCSEMGYTDPSIMDNNLSRIIYEVENGIQWISTDSYPLSFEEFAKSALSIEYLARAFLLCYERPADQSSDVQDYRASLADAWGEKLGSVTPTPSTPSTPITKKKFNFILFNAQRRRETWIK